MTRWTLFGIKFIYSLRPRGPVCRCETPKPFQELFVQRHPGSLEATDVSFSFSPKLVIEAQFRVIQWYYTVIENCFLELKSRSVSQCAMLRRWEVRTVLKKVPTDFKSRLQRKQDTFANPSSAFGLADCRTAHTNFRSLAQPLQVAGSTWALQKRRVWKQKSPMFFGILVMHFPARRRLPVHPQGARHKGWVVDNTPLWCAFSSASRRSCDILWPIWLHLGIDVWMAGGT